MASGKQGLLVVVWEWENKQRRWRPYPPEVTQHLERAHSKNLRSVILGDSDPSLKNYLINLPQMEQECKTTGERVKVRRTFYPQSSPAGQGAVWQWAGDGAGDWHTYDMCVQCVIEESWGTGAQTLDMSKNFAMCPYVINFCNLTQMNKKTGFIRAIRRVQQAAYPVGKPPPHHLPGNNSNNNSSYLYSNSSSSSGSKAPGSTGAGLVTGMSGERPKRRGSRDEVEMSNADTSNKPRSIFGKVLGRAHSNSSSRNSSLSPPASTSSNSSISTVRVGGQGIVAADTISSPPRPLPRSQVPPKPKPRTSVPQARPLYPAQPPGDQQHLLDPHDCYGHTNTLRSEGSGGRFGSNHTLDSDCSSLVSGSRRPSVDTISTYLSQESCVGDEEGAYGGSSRSVSHHQSSGGVGNPRVDQLIHVESDESMDDDGEDDDDDVFGEDQEVCDVMRGVAGRSSPPRAPSPLPHHHHPHHHQSPHSQQNLFVPISTAQSGSDLGLQLNGVKRKRTGERAGPSLTQHPSGGGGDYQHHNNHHHNNNNHHYHHHKHHQGSRAPIAPEDQLLVEYTSTVTSPPNETCSICMWSLQEPSGYSDDDSASSAARASGGVGNDGVVSLVLCRHQFHLACVREMAKSSSQYLECPNCKTLHGEKHGNQPHGEMLVTTLNSSLPGHPNCDTFKITYKIRDGVQGPEHPHPGRRYHAVGFPRIAYVPMNEKGRRVVKLLREAWRRRLIFTIGRSVTLGQDDCVTWNEIHHKTEWKNFTGHGYPDPHYLDNALKELELHGVTEATLV